MALMRANGYTYGGDRRRDGLAALPHSSGCRDGLLDAEGRPLPRAASLMAALERLGPEALLPVADGGDPVWVGADPTNRVLSGETHVKIGHGRHYADVPPIKGVYRGTASARLAASVTMTRLERTDPASIARS
jgi:hypothetical protein